MRGRSREKPVLTSGTAEAGQTNIAFACALQLDTPEACIDLLLSTSRAPEAALFSKTYAPSQTSRVVKEWKKELETAKKGKLASTIADPEVDVDAFEGWEDILKREAEGQLMEIEDVDEPEAAVEDEAVAVETPSLLLNGVDHLSLHDAAEETEDEFGEDCGLLTTRTDSLQLSRLTMRSRSHRTGPQRSPV